MVTRTVDPPNVEIQETEIIELDNGNSLYKNTFSTLYLNKNLGLSILYINKDHSGYIIILFHFHHPNFFCIQKSFMYVDTVSCE